MNSKQVVLITGSSSGFGRLFTETLARKGHTVFATMRAPGGRNAKNASDIRALAERDGLLIHLLELGLFASESGDPARNIASVLDVYRRTQDWQGAPDATRCGTSKDNALLPIEGPELF